MAAAAPEVRTRLGSDPAPEIARLAVGSDEGGGWGKVLTAHSSRDQGISLEEEEEDREILEEKRDTADLRHIVMGRGFGSPNH